MIEIAGINGSASFFLNVAEIESIFEREGNTSEIVMLSEWRYRSIWSKDKIAEKINQFIIASIVSNDAN